MAEESLLAGLAEEATLSEVLGDLSTLLAQMVNQMPRLDVNRRMLVSSIEAQPTVSINSSQTLNQVTTVVGLTGMGAAVRDAGAVPIYMANVGAQHLYNNIIVS